MFSGLAWETLKEARMWLWAACAVTAKDERPKYKEEPGYKWGFAEKLESHISDHRELRQVIEQLTHISFAFVFVLSISVYCTVICKMDLGMEELKKEAGNKTGNSSCCNMIREQLFLCWLWSLVRWEEFLERLSRNSRGCAYRFDIMNASLERLETMPRCPICRVNRVEMSLV